MSSSLSKSKKVSDAAEAEARERDQAVKHLDVEMRDAWWKMAEHVFIMHSKRLWEYLADNFGAWLDKSVPTSRRTAYDAKKVWDGLREIPKATRVQIPRQNAKQLVKLTESKRKSKKWIDMAIKMTENEFKAAVKADQTGAEKREEYITKHYHYEKSQWAIIEQAFEMMKSQVPEVTINGKFVPEVANEALAAAYILVHQGEARGKSA